VTTTQENTKSAAQEPRLRASDLDRLATVRVLQDAVARGLLTLDEGSDRMAAAFAAVHVAELGPLTADLPSARERTAPGWRPLGTMALEQVRSSLHAPWSGRLSPARIAVAVFIAFVLLMLIGSMFAELFFDGGRDFGHHHGFDRD
jgi:Domain of unknown function (DUF1707)